MLSGLQGNELSLPTYTPQSSGTNQAPTQNPTLSQSSPQLPELPATNSSPEQSTPLGIQKTFEQVVKVISQMLDVLVQSIGMGSPEPGQSKQRTASASSSLSTASTSPTQSNQSEGRAADSNSKQSIETKSQNTAAPVTGSGSVSGVATLPTSTGASLAMPGTSSIAPATIPYMQLPQGTQSSSLAKASNAQSMPQVLDFITTLFQMFFERLMSFLGKRLPERKPVPSPAPSPTPTPTLIPSQQTPPSSQQEPGAASQPLPIVSTEGGTIPTSAPAPITTPTLSNSATSIAQPTENEPTRLDPSVQEPETLPSPGGTQSPPAVVVPLPIPVPIPVPFPSSDCTCPPSPTPTAPVTPVTQPEPGPQPKQLDLGKPLPKSNGQFLWKPVSDKDGKLAVLLPATLTGKVDEVAILRPDGTRVRHTGNFSGVANGNREHYRFGIPGAEYKDGAIVLIKMKDGSRFHVRITETSNRVER